MNKLKNKSKKIKLLILFLVLSVSLGACASIRDKISVTKGQLVGNDFIIKSYDHYGMENLSMKGRKVGIELLEENVDADETEAKYSSSVLEITINGKQILQVGNTLIFAESGLDMVEDFQMPDEIEVEKGGSLMVLDRNINHIKNKLGKEKTIIISTPKGVPIGVYQGKKVYATVPKDLPKMTRLNIDGKSLYIHRANYMIVDTDIIS